MTRLWSNFRRRYGSSPPTIASEAISASGIQLVGYVVALVASVVIARAVGPSGRGQYSVAIAAALIVGSVLDLSVLKALTYFRAERGHALPELAGITGALTLLVAPVGVGAMFAVYAALRHAVFADLNLIDFSLAAVAVPFHVSLNWMGGLFALGGRVALSRLAIFFGGFAQTAAAVALYLLHALDVRAVLIMYLGATLIPWVLCVSWSRSFAPVAPRLNRQLIGETVRLGIQLHVGFVFWYLLLYVDTFLVKAFLGAGATGRYSLAALFGGVLWILVEPITWAALPVQSEAPLAEASQITFKAVRFSLAIALVLASAAAAVLWIAIPLLYGSRFGGAYAAFAALIPGIVAMATAGPVQNALVRQGRPRTMAAVNLVTFGLNVGLNVALLKPLGIVGASVAASAAYGANALVFVLWAAKAWDVSIWKALTPQPGDVETVRRLIQAVIPRRAHAEV